MALLYTHLKITAIFLVMGSAIMVPAVRGIRSNPQSFVLSNFRAKYIVREFSKRSNASEEELANGDVTLFDFTTLENLNNWTEQSDVVRTVGKSKAVIDLQKTREFQRAVFFTLLNPQPNGAGFAGVRTATSLNLTGLSNIEINCRGQGQNEGYKIVLRHRGEDNEPYPTYEQFFTAPMSSQNFSTVSLPLSEFKAYYRGKEVPDAESLDLTSITNFGLQVYGGVYKTVHQSAVSSLEINTIIATV